MANNKLYFNTLSAALLFNWELSGQISDGKYENARPYNHWKWICDTEVYVDKNTKNYTNRWIRKTYNLNEWGGYMKDGSNSWAWRCAKYVRFGACFESTQENYERIAVNVSSSAVELLKEKYDSYEDCKVHIKNEQFFEIFTEEVYNKYYSQEISIKEFNKYHKLMKETVNRSEEDAIRDADIAARKAAAKEAEKEAKKAAKKAEAEAKKNEMLNKMTQVTSATTEDELIAPKNNENKMDVITLKYNLLKYAKEQLGVDIKELSVKF